MLTFIVGIFSDTTRVDEIHNTEGWYDFGFLFGTTAIWGGGSSTIHHNNRKKARDKEWEDISKKVEAKIKRKDDRVGRHRPDTVSAPSAHRAGARRHQQARKQPEHDAIAQAVRNPRPTLQRPTDQRDEDHDRDPSGAVEESEHDG